MPESTWRTFNYQENDDNYDATDFARFVWGSIRVAKTTRTADILQRRLTPRGDGLTWAVNVGRGRVPMLTVMRAVDDVLELAQHDAAKAAALGLEVAEVPGSRDQVVFDLQRGEVQVSSGPVAGLQSGGWPDPEVLRQLKGLGFRPVLS